jgi:hypothetical protein
VLGFFHLEHNIHSLISLGKLIGADNRILAMAHWPNKIKAMGSNSTLMHFYYLVYFSDLHFLLTRVIIGLAHMNPHAGVEY